MDPAALGRAVGLIEARGAVAQVCVLRHGQVVLDRAFGCDPGSLFLIFSAGKPFVAVLVHLLAERGQLALDDPVARYWPEFGRRGKGAITIRQVLQHRAGLPVAHNLPRDALAAPHWQRAVHGLELARPSWPPGQVPAYHILSFGFILGEVVQRVTGADLREVMRAELLRPLGLADTYLGLPPEAWHRHVPVRGHGPVTRARQVVFNRRAVRAAVVPAATVSTTARDLARFYEMLLHGDEFGGAGCSARRPSRRPHGRRPTARPTGCSGCRSAGRKDSSSAGPGRIPAGRGPWAPPAARRRSATTAPTAAWPGRIPPGDWSSRTSPTGWRPASTARRTRARSATPCSPPAGNRGCRQAGPAGTAGWPRLGPPWPPVAAQPSRE